MSLIWVVILLPLLFYIFQAIALGFKRNIRSIPGPILNRFTKIPLKIRVLTGYRTSYIHDLHQKYGSIVRIGPNEISISDIDSFHTVHKIGSSFIKARWYQSMNPLQTNDENSGVFALRDSRKAAARRKFFQKAGTKSAVKEWEPRVVEMIDQVIGKIKRDSIKGKADILKWFSMMTADVLSELAFGHAFRVIEKEEKPQIIVDIETSMMIAGLYLEFPLLWMIIERLPFAGTKKMVGFFDRITEYGMMAVENTKSAPKGSGKTIFSKMYPDDDEPFFPDKIMAQEAANLIIAGTDTTALTLTYLTYVVLKRPDVKKRLLDEVSKGATWEELEGKKYLNNVIQETLRLYPPVLGSLPRTSPEKDVLLGGYIVPAETVVSGQAHTIHRNPNVFPNPERFDPDRWDNPTPQMKEYFIPFGGSSRVCLGQNLAKLELLHTVNRLFVELPDIRLADTTTEKSMERMDYFVVKPASGKCEVTMNENYL